MGQVTDHAWIMRGGERLLPRRSGARELDHAGQPLTGRRVLDRRQGEVQGRASSIEDDASGARAGIARPRLQRAGGGATYFSSGRFISLPRLSESRRRHETFMERRQNSQSPSPTFDDDPPSQSPALATSPGALGKPAACIPKPRDAAGPARRARSLARAWHAARGAWLARRLARVEAELQMLTARLTDPRIEGDRESSRQALWNWESCCMERAVLRARIERCRSAR